MSTVQLNRAARLAEGHSALTKSALLASDSLTETCATLALARACSQLRLAVTNYERAGYGSRVTQPLRDAIASIEASFNAAQSRE